MAKIAAQAFFDDELLGDLIHPHRHQYPEDMHLWWLKRMRKGWTDPRNHFLVSTSKDGEVAAWVQWMRKGISSDGRQVVEQTVELPEDRAADPEYVGALEKAYGCFGPGEWIGTF